MDQDKKVNEIFDVLGSKTESVSGNHVEEKTHPYQLRNRDRINKSVRYTQNPETVKQINILKRKFTGKKLLITKKITQINELVQQRSSRTKILYLRESLNQLYSELVKENEDLMNLIDEENYQECITEMQFEVDTCNSNVQAYLDSRKDDPPSETQSVSSWAKQCLNDQILHNIETQDDRASKEGFSNLASQLNQLTLGPNAPEFKPKEGKVNNGAGYSNVNNMVQNQNVDRVQESESPANVLVKPCIYDDIPYDAKTSTVIKQNAVSSWDQSLYRVSKQHNHDASNINLQPSHQWDYKPNIPGSPEERFNQSVSITKNFVDSWIDEPNPETVNNGNEHKTQNQNIQLSWLMQQRLP